ncbi:MAG TPA: tyrosine--tRNA ligase [Candidatus Tripitaka sp. YC43]
MMTPQDPKSQLETLKRGTIDIVREEELLEKLQRSYRENRPIRVKLGLDPTAPDIHIGNAIPLQKLKKFQELGHQAVLIIGDYTALVGDPAGVNKTRPMLSREEVMANARTYLQQVGKILDLPRTEIVYNSQWFEEMGFSEILRLTSKMTVARMLERDDFSQRYATGTPISLHEFLYPLMQGYDSVMVRSDVELGGTDQLFSLLVGRDLQRDFGQEPQVALTTPLLEGIDGNKKMSKSLGNYIGITEEPAQIFGKAMSIKDDLMKKYFVLATDMDDRRIDELLAHSVHPRQAKAELARAIVRRYWGEEAASLAAQEFDRVFKAHELPEQIQEVIIPRGELKDGKLWMVRLLILAGFATTNSDARRLITQGGVHVGAELARQSTFREITDPKADIEVATGMILKVGRRRFAKVVVKD